MVTLKVWIGILLLVTTGLSAVESSARREVRTEKQKARLAKANIIQLDIIVLTDAGEQPPDQVWALVTRRLTEIDYAVVTDVRKPHDVTFKVKCEQRKVWEGTTASGGDADLPDSPSRVWKGPACQLTYFLSHRNLGWRKEVRTDFVDAVNAAAKAKADDPGAYALAKLMQRLEEYDFPILLTADWGQDERLLKILERPDTSQDRRVRIITRLGQMFSSNAVPRLQVALKDPNVEVAKAAAIALGNIGHKESIEALVETLKTSENSELQAAAVKGLGQVGALHGDVSVIPPLLEALNTDNITLKTEVVWALGKIPDKRANEPLLAIQRSLQNVRTSDRHSKEAKLWDAVSYSLKQIDRYDQVN
jgi:hypothetical protein